jgi:hypothetical protein
MGIEVLSAFLYIDAPGQRRALLVDVKKLLWRCERERERGGR